MSCDTPPPGAAAPEPDREPAEALRISQARKAAMLEAALDAVVCMDHEGRIVELSGAAERMFGLSREEAVGAEMAEVLIPPRLRDAHHAGLRRYLETGEARVLRRRIEVEGQRADGSEIPVELAIVPIELDGEPPLFTAYLRDLSRPHRAERALREAEQRVRTLVTAASMLVWAVDGDLTVTLAEGRGLPDLGAGEAPLVGRPLAEVAPDPALVEQAQRALDGEEEEATLRLGDRVVDTRAAPLRDAGGAIVGAVGAAVDVTRRARAEAALRRSQLELAEAQAIARLGSFEWRRSSDAIALSVELRRILGFALSAEAVPRERYLEALHPDDRERVVRALEGAAADGGRTWVEHRVVRPDGEVRVLQAHARVVAGEDGRLRRVAGTAQDVTERRRDEERIAHLAYHDALTDLPNRLLLAEHLDAALARARREGTSVAVLFLDLDHFKQVNDRFGHLAGDELLRQVARRLRAPLRDRDLVGRHGGDEFVVLLCDLDGDAPAAARTVAAKLADELAEPIALAGVPLTVAASVGIAVAPGDAEDAGELLRRADAAMYEAKRQA